MRADIILVVMNGEVVEEGSHNSLVAAGGKYHDLWSKQIFVTPPVAGDSKGQDKLIINDVTDSKNTMSMAQALGKEPAPADEGDKDKSGASSKSRGKNSRPHIPKADNEDENPFTKNLEQNKTTGKASSEAPAKAALTKRPDDKQGEEVSTAPNDVVDTPSSQHP